VRRAFGLVVILLVFAALSACGSSEARPERCDLCGMIVDESSGWRAGGSAADGSTLVFDAPKCLMRYTHQRGEVRGAWVIEYYTQERRPARELFYVIGSDLESPMGRDLVPIAGREAGERLVADHHGEAVLSYDEVSAQVVEALFTPRP
jgi:nitrous oxide reductase accessory protein NosL